MKKRLAIRDLPIPPCVIKSSAVAFCLAAALACGCRHANTRPVVALNNDNTEMAYHMTPESANAEGVRDYFFKVSKGGLTHFLINPNAHNAAYPSKVWDTVWHEDPRLKPSSHLKQFDNSRILAEKGVDWIRIMVDCCREQGVSPWISMRMNDIHNIGDNLQFACSKFWLDHPEFRRVPGKLKGSSFDSDLAYDYTHPEVRAHSLALAREMLDKWDVDGFECDWLRFPHHIPSSAEESRSGCAPITEFMRELRKIADEVGRRRGKRILIAARVASMPDAAIGLGTDPFAWAREGLVDSVSPCCFFTTDDFAIPYVEWKSRLAAANPNVRLVCGFDFAGIDRGRGGPSGVTAAEFGAYLERAIAAGITDFEAFNRFICGGDEVSRYIQVEGMPDVRNWVYRRPRTYPVTWHDAVPSGYPTGRALPCKLTEAKSFSIPIGRTASPSSAGVVMSFEGSVACDLAKLVALNGTPATSFEEAPTSAWLPGATAGTKCYLVHFPASAVHDGANAITVAKSGDGTRLMYLALTLIP